MSDTTKEWETYKKKFKGKRLEKQFEENERALENCICLSIKMSEIIQNMSEKRLHLTHFLLKLSYTRYVYDIMTSVRIKSHSTIHSVY